MYLLPLTENGVGGTGGGTDRATGNWLVSDLCRDTTGTAASFLVDLPNAKYDIEFVIGDQYANAGDIDVTAEGVLVAENVSYTNGQFLTFTAQVEITDGQLDLGFSNDTGNSWVINYLMIEPTYCGASGTVYLNGDINEDCYVDFKDVAELTNDWVKCTDPNNTDCSQYY